MILLDGKALSSKILENVKQRVKKLEKQPHLVVILAGSDAASQVYVRNKQKASEKVGIKSTVIETGHNVSEKELLGCIKDLNHDNSVTGILVQLPLPEHINKNKITTAISPLKDVDGFHPENVGKLALGLEPYFYPATPQGIIMLLDEYNIPLEGKDALVIGRSNIVGRPMAQMLLRHNATVTIAHSHTKNLKTKIQNSDIIISAVGKKIVETDNLKDNAVVIDVGIFKDENNKLTGDVDFKKVSKAAKYITPVPGGVGPMTIASLMFNASKIYV